MSGKETDRGDFRHQPLERGRNLGLSRRLFPTTVEIETQIRLLTIFPFNNTDGLVALGTQIFYLPHLFRGQKYRERHTIIFTDLLGPFLVTHIRILFLQLRIIRIIVKINIPDFHVRFKPRVRPESLFIKINMIG